MRILLRDGRVIGTATDEYIGPEQWELKPDSIPFEDIYGYTFTNGTWKEAVPTSITKRQARLILIEQDLLDTVEAVIDSIPDSKLRKIARIEWDTADVIKRDWPLLVQLVKAEPLSWTDEQIDQFFITAGKL
jgi:hypothetical protein